MASRRAVLVLAAVTGIALWPGRSHGADAPRRPIQIVTADDSETTKRIVDELRKRFPSASTDQELAKRRPEGKAPIYVTIGPAALRSLLSKGPEGAVFSAFSSSQAYRQALSTVQIDARTTATTAIYAEPSPATQMRLISMLYKKPVKTGVILSDKTAYAGPVLQRAATQANLPLSVEILDAVGSLGSLQKTEKIVR